MNKNYRAGYLVEREIKILLEKQGYTVSRSSGSLGIFDLVAFNKQMFRLIQVKRTKNKAVSYKKEIEKIRNFKNYPYNARKELWIKLPRVKFNIIVIE